MLPPFNKTAGRCVMGTNRLRPLLPSRSGRGDDAHAKCMADVTRAAINTDNYSRFPHKRYEAKP